MLIGEKPCRYQSEFCDDLNRLDRLWDQGIRDILENVALSLALLVRVGQSTRAVEKAMELHTTKTNQRSDQLTISLKAQALSEELMAKRHHATQSRSDGSNVIHLDPRLLVFEFLFDLMLRESQVRILGTFLSSARHGQAMCHQMIMGDGKTTVIAPLLSLILADGKSLVCACMPSALLEMSRGVLARCKGGRRTFLYLCWTLHGLIFDETPNWNSLDIFENKLTLRGCSMNLECLPAAHILLPGVSLLPLHQKRWSPSSLAASHVLIRRSMTSWRQVNRRKWEARKTAKSDQSSDVFCFTWCHVL